MIEIQNIHNSDKFWYFNTKLLLNLPVLITIKEKQNNVIYYYDNRDYIRAANMTILDDLFLTEEEALLEFMIVYKKTQETGEIEFIAHDEEFKKKQKYIYEKYTEYFV